MIVIIKNLTAIFTAFIIGTISFSSQSFADAYRGTGQDLQPANLCLSPKVVKVIAEKFHHQARYQLHSVLPTALLAIEDIKFTGYESAAERNGIRHWFCQGYSRLNDGSRHLIYYKIEKAQPFTAFNTTNIEYCMESFSPWRAHNGFCRSVRAHNLGAKFKPTNYKA